MARPVVTEPLDSKKVILEHHGVKGMKWGTRRRYNKQTRRLIDANAHRQLRGLTDAELLAVVNRMQLEKKYSDLKRSSRSEGKEYAVNLIKTAGTTTVQTVAKTVIAPSIIKTMETSAEKAVSKQQAEKAAVAKAKEDSLAIAKKRLEKNP